MLDETCPHNRGYYLVDLHARFRYQDTGAYETAVLVCAVALDWTRLSSELDCLYTTILLATAKSMHGARAVGAQISVTFLHASRVERARGFDRLPSLSDVRTLSFS